MNGIAMASDSIAINSGGVSARSISERLHDWVVTVDHKKLGILYIVYALVLLVIGGIEATSMRIQLMRPAQSFRVAGSVQSPVHHARHHHDFLRGDADLVRVRDLSDSLDDWRAGYGLPAAERFEFLAYGIRRPASLLQFHRRERALRRRQRAGRGLVRVCAADFAPLLARSQHRLLDTRRCWFPVSAALARR